MLPPAPCLSALLVSLQLGYASHYGDPGDDNGRFACRRLLLHKLGRRGWERALAQGIAHRTLPCGAVVRLYDLRTGRSTTATKVDHGPHGQVLPSGRWTARRALLPGARWRGIVDLLPPVAARLGLTGLHPVLISVVRPAPATHRP